MSQYKRKPSPAKKIAILTFYWILQLLPFFCLLNKPSTHKHAEWSGKSSLTLVKEVTSRAEMAACHFPCQDDICHSLLSCFFGGENEPLPQQGWSSSPAPVPLFCFGFFFFQKILHFSFCSGVHLLGEIKALSYRVFTSSARSWHYFSSYNKNFVYYTYHSISLGKKKPAE